LSESAFAGGIIGYSYGGAVTLEGCSNTAGVNVSSSVTSELFAGGIIGISGNSASLSQCFNTGQVTASTLSSSSVYAGGALGCSSRSLKIENCYSTGSVGASTNGRYAYAAGAIGYAEGTAVITNYYSNGTIIADSDEPFGAGLIGYAEGATIMNCYFLEGEIRFVADILYQGTATVDGNTDGTPREGPQGSGAKFDDEMRPDIRKALSGDSIFFIGDPDGWDFREIWTLDPEVNNGNPIFGRTEIPEDPEDPDPEDPEGPDCPGGSEASERQWILCVLLIACSISMTSIMLGYIIYLRERRRGKR
jgi:hypothetical protein